MTERRQPAQPEEISPAILLTVSPAARRPSPAANNICRQNAPSVENIWQSRSGLSQLSSSKCGKTSSWADLHTDVNSKHQRVWQTQDGEPAMLAADAVTHPVTWHESEIIRWHESDSVNSNEIIEEAATKTCLFYSSLMDSAVGSTAFWEVQLSPLIPRTVDIKYQVLFAEELLLASPAWQNVLT